MHYEIIQSELFTFIYPSFFYIKSSGDTQMYFLINETYAYVSMNGLGDKSYNYVYVLCHLIYLILSFKNLY